MVYRKFWFPALLPNIIPYSIISERFQCHPTYIAACTCSARGTGAHDASQSSFHRALAFAHDVELRLNPWYGRPRTRVAEEPNPASPPTSNSGVSPTGTTRRGDCGDSGGISGNPVGGSSGRDDGADREERQTRRETGVSLSTKKKDDLLACG